MAMMACSCCACTVPRGLTVVSTAMGDVGAISYFYVLENTFFSLLLVFAWVSASQSSITTTAAAGTRCVLSVSSTCSDSLCLGVCGCFLALQCYFDPKINPYIRMLWPLECVFVFLMYLPPIRAKWPISSFRDSLNTTKGMSEANKSFFIVSTYVVKFFYVYVWRCQLARRPRPMCTDCSRRRVQALTLPLLA